MHGNIWRDKNLCSTNLCDLRLTHMIHINKSHAEICRFKVYMYIHLYMLYKGSWLGDTFVQLNSTRRGEGVVTHPPIDSCTCTQLHVCIADSVHVHV